MKRIIITLLIFMPLLCGVKAGHGWKAIQDQTDTSAQKAIPPSIKSIARATTDMQIDSIYSVNPELLKALRNQFQELRSYQDTLNAQSIIRERMAEQAAVERDRATNALLRQIDQNTRLERENARLTRTNEFMKSIPHYLVSFVLSFAAVLIGYGVIVTIPKLKKNEKE